MRPTWPQLHHSRRIPYCFFDSISCSQGLLHGRPLFRLGRRSNEDGSTRMQNDALLVLLLFLLLSFLFIVIFFISSSRLHVLSNFSDSRRASSVEYESKRPRMFGRRMNGRKPGEEFETSEIIRAGPAARASRCGSATRTGARSRPPRSGPSSRPSSASFLAGSSAVEVWKFRNSILPGNLEI